MGYDVHITLAKDWTESKKRPIPLAKWKAYVSSDPEMTLEDTAIAYVKGKPALSYQNDGLAVWTAYSKHKPKGNKAWFDYRQGCVVVKNPDEEILTKMKAIAKHFKARVMGDDGEGY